MNSLEKTRRAIKNGQATLGIRHRTKKKNTDDHNTES
jgi:hypothetical protein